MTDEANKYGPKHESGIKRGCLGQDFGGDGDWYGWETIRGNLHQSMRGAVG